MVAHQSLSARSVAQSSSFGHDGRRRLARERLGPSAAVGEGDLDLQRLAEVGLGHGVGLRGRAGDGGVAAAVHPHPLERVARGEVRGLAVAVVDVPLGRGQCLAHLRRAVDAGLARGLVVDRRGDGGVGAGLRGGAQADRADAVLRKGRLVVRRAERRRVGGEPGPVPGERVAAAGGVVERQLLARPLEHQALVLQVRAAGQDPERDARQGLRGEVLHLGVDGSVDEHVVQERAEAAGALAREPVKLVAVGADADGHGREEGQAGHRMVPGGEGRGLDAGGVLEGVVGGRLVGHGHRLAAAGGGGERQGDGVAVHIDAVHGHGAAAHGHGEGGGGGYRAAVEVLGEGQRQLAAARGGPGHHRGEVRAHRDLLAVLPGEAGGGVHVVGVYRHFRVVVGGERRAAEVEH